MVISDRTFKVLTGFLLATHLLPLLYFLLRIGPLTPLDSDQYLELARVLADTGRFGWFCSGVFGPESVRMPGYPAFIATFFVVFGEKLWPIVIAQSFLYLGSVLFIWRAACRVFGRQTGLLFLLISASYPFVAFWTVNIMAEMSCVFLLSAAVYFLTKRRAIDHAIGSLAIVLGSYFRPNLILLGIFIGVCCVLISGSTRLRFAAVVVVVAIAGMVPWAVRNYQTFGVISPLPVVKGTGLSLFVSSWQGRVSTETLVKWGTDSIYTDEARMSGFYDQVEEIKRKVDLNLEGRDKVDTLTLLEKCDSNEKKALIEAEMGSAAINNIYEHPFQFAFGVSINLIRMWVTVFGLKDLPSVLQTLLITQSLMLVVLGYLGILILVVRRKLVEPSVFVFVSLVSYFVLTQAALHTEARYTIPGRLPIMVIAAYVLWELGIRLGRFRSYKSLVDVT